MGGGGPFVWITKLASTILQGPKLNFFLQKLGRSFGSTIFISYWFNVDEIEETIYKVLNLFPLCSSLYASAHAGVSTPGLIG